MISNILLTNLAWVPSLGRNCVTPEASLCLNWTSFAVLTSSSLDEVPCPADYGMATLVYYGTCRRQPHQAALTIHAPYDQFHDADRNPYKTTTSLMRSVLPERTDFCRVKHQKTMNIPACAL